MKIAALDAARAEFARPFSWAAVFDAVIHWGAVIAVMSALFVHCHREAVAAETGQALSQLHEEPRP